MPAPQTINVPSKLAIVSGGGTLPVQLAERCRGQGIEPFLIGFAGQTDRAAITAYPHIWTSLGRAGSVMKALKARGIQDIVMIGAMKRPQIWQLWPDWKTLTFFAKIGFRALGDAGFLSILRAELESEGFRLHGVHRFLPELLAPQGCLTKTAPAPEDRDSIALGIRESQRIGALDIGQSVVVQGARILGVEDNKGTNALIRRCPAATGGAPAFLVKTCKPQQDRDLDLPTIGASTVENCHRAGIKGIVVQAGATLLTEREKLVELADKYQIFVLSVDIKDYRKP
jgi:hypothetical protein